MDDTLRSEALGNTASPNATGAARRALRGGNRSHPLVASLAGGLRATYAAEPEDAMPDLFASLIARLDGGASDAN